MPGPTRNGDMLPEDRVIFRFVNNFHLNNVKLKSSMGFNFNYIKKSESPRLLEAGLILMSVSFCLKKS